MNLVAMKFCLGVSEFIIGKEGVTTVVVWAGSYTITVVREDCAKVGGLINIIDCGL